jgi:hypothetical protein
MDNIERSARMVEGLLAARAEEIRGTWPTAESGSSRGARAVTVWVSATGAAGDWVRNLLVTMERTEMPGYAVEAVVRNEEGEVIAVASARVGPNLLFALAESFALAGIWELNEAIAGRV